MTITIDTPSTILDSTEAAIVAAVGQGWKVYGRGKRIVAITAEGEPRYLGGGDADRRWDAMRPLDAVVTLDEV